MNFDMESILAAKAELEKLGPIKRHLDVTQAEYDALRSVCKTETRPTPQSLMCGLELRIVEPEDNPILTIPPSPEI